MTSALIKLVTMLAFVLMPIGMSPAAAAVSVAPVAESPMGHCADHSGSPSGKATHSTDCAGCIAVPAIAARIAEQIDSPEPRDYRAPMRLRTGLHPETSTPPPKLS